MFKLMSSFDRVHYHLHLKAEKNTARIFYRVQNNFDLLA